MLRSLTGRAAKMHRCTPTKDAWVQDENPPRRVPLFGDGSPGKNSLAHPLSGMSGFEVQNLLETLHPIRFLFDDGSHNKNGQVQPTRDAWVPSAKAPQNFASYEDPLGNL